MALTYLRTNEIETIDALRKAASESDSVLGLLIFLSGHIHISSSGTPVFPTDVECVRYLEVIRLAGLMAKPGEE